MQAAAPFATCQARTRPGRIELAICAVDAGRGLSAAISDLLRMGPSGAVRCATVLPESCIVLGPTVSDSSPGVLLFPIACRPVTLTGSGDAAQRSRFNRHQAPGIGGRRPVGTVQGQAGAGPPGAADGEAAVPAGMAG